MKIFKRQRGQTLVEFAFVFPIFFLLFIGMMYGGMFCFDLLTFKNVAIQQANIAAEKKISAETGQTEVRLFLKNLYDESLLEGGKIKYTLETKEQTKTVTINVKMKSNLTYLSQFLPTDTLKIEGKAVVRN